jgi:hypothetical protein
VTGTVIEARTKTMTGTVIEAMTGAVMGCDRD